MQVDFKKVSNKFEIFTQNGSNKLKLSAKNYLTKLIKFPVGEFLLNSIDRDGTENGLDFDILKCVPKDLDKSLIISGGCGNSKHLSAGLKNKKLML